MYLLLVSSSFIALIQICYSQNFGERINIPIGVMLNQSEREKRASLDYEVSRHNQTRFKFKPNFPNPSVNVEDAYSVIAAMCSLMSTGVFTMLGSHSTHTISAIKSYTSTFHMPFVSTSMAVNMSKQENAYEVYMSPLIAQAMFDLIKHYNWNKAYYFYKSKEGLYRFQQLLEAANRDGVLFPVELKRITDVMELLDILDELNKIDNLEKKIIVDLPSNDIEDFLDKQKKDSTKRIRFHFMLAELNVRETLFDDYRMGGINLTNFNLVDYTNKSVKHYMDAWRQKSPEVRGTNLTKIPIESLLMIDALTLVEKTMTTILNRDSRFFNDVLRQGAELDCDNEPLIPWRHGDIIIKTMKEVEFTGLTGKVAFDKYGLRKDYKLDVMEITLSESQRKIGSWTQLKGFQRESSGLQIRIKGNSTISNKTRIITSILSEPYLMEKAGYSKNDSNRFEGFCADLAEYIKEIIKFDYIIVPVKDGKYGSQNENNTWDGMIGELIENKADLAIAPLTITSDREKVVDFSKPFMNLGISIMIAKPEKQQPHVFSFMAPLSYEIWMCIAFAYIGVSVVLFLVSRFSPYEWHVEDTTEGPSVSNNFTIFNSLWFSLAAFMQQGVDVEPRSISGRVVGSVWWFFTLIIISSYTANLAAFLTVERMQSPIESAEDLAKQTEIKYGVVASGSTKEFFRKSTINVYERMWAAMAADKSVFVNNNSEGFDKVRAGKYAFLSESTTIDYQNQRYPCNTMKVGGNLDSKGYGIATPFGSDLRDKITLAVLELKEAGKLQKLENKWWLDKGQCGNETTSTKKEPTSSLQLVNVAGIFYILMGGVVLSLLMAALEFLYKSHVEAKRRKSSFSATVYSRAKLSIRGMPGKQMTAYAYAPAAQLVTLDGYGETNSFTQV